MARRDLALTKVHETNHTHRVDVYGQRVVVFGRSATLLT